MKKTEWHKELEFFLAPHPELHPEAGEVYTPKEGYEISFLFNGVPAISGKHSELEVNFNSDEFVILSKDGVTTRILWGSFIGFELISVPHDHVRKAKLYVVPKQKT